MGTSPPKNNGQRTTNHGLPCQDSSAACLQTLSDLAVQNNLEIVVLEQAIQLQKKKLWTSWLNADGWHPLAIGLRIVRNVAGGGDRAALQIEIARLEVHRAELAANLRQTVRQAVWDYERRQQELVAAQNKLAFHLARGQLAEIGYRLGESQTETMLAMWQTSEELQTQVAVAASQLRTARNKLESILGFK